MIMQVSYQGLNWGNFGVWNSQVYASGGNTDGFVLGMVSPPNVAYNLGGDPVTIHSFLHGTNFNFFSVYLTSGLASNLNIEVQGFRSLNLLYDQSVTVGTTNPTLFTFNFLDIDKLTFTPSGGFPTWIVMDNLNFELVPEPCTLFLTVAGALLLWPIPKRKPS